MKKWLSAAVFFFSVSSFAAEEDCSELLQTAIQRQADEIEQLQVEYRKVLGIFVDPFDLVWSPEEGERLFARLTVHKEGKDWIPGPLGVINTELKKSLVFSVSYDEEMVGRLLSDIRSSLGKDGTERMDRQSNLLALKYIREYLRRFEKKQEIIDRDGERIEETKQEKEDSPKPKEQQTPQPPPRYPKLPKSYKPFTKDVSQTGGEQTPYRVAEVNFKAKLFVGRRYGEILRYAPEPFNEGVLPLAQRQPGKFKKTSRKMIVHTLGEREVTLFLPSGYRPLQPSDARASIFVEESGGYVLRLKANLSEVVIPLVEDSKIVLMAPVLEYYSRPVGFAENEWPDKIQAEVLRRFSREAGLKQPLEVARTLTQHISQEYLYSINARVETDPIDALNGGSFQCDMAAFIMIGILRDVYQIPARAVGGYPAKKYKSGADQKSYLVLPATGHAWVEVFHAGEWHTFDPTPVKKDGKESEDDSQSEYSSWESGTESSKKNEESSLKEQRPRGNQERENHISRLQKNTEEGLEKNLTDKEKLEFKKDEELSLKELADNLELGSLELEPKQDNPLTARAMRVFLQTALDPHRKGEEVQTMLNGMLKVSREFSDPQFSRLYREALDVHSGNHPGLNDWVEQLIAKIPKQDLNKTHQDMFKFKSSLEIFAKVMDLNGGIPYPGKLLELLDSAYALINAQIHPDAKDIGIVQHLAKNLPELALQLLKRRYDLSSVGPNSPTMKVAQQMRKGKLSDLRLMAILNPLTDFILNASPRPDSIEVRQWQRNLRRTMGRDLLPLERPSDVTRAIIQRPDLSIEDNIKNGTIFVPTRRQITPISLGYGKDEAERISIVLYDTSGSMSGSTGHFQAGLISTFTAKALSDLSPSGRHRHKVVLVPFDSEPKKPIPVTNAAQGLDIIDNYHTKLGNTGGGTDIQAALMQAMSLIADAEKRSGEPLAAANIILMTDGQSDIDAKELYRARSAIDRQTPLQTMFISIGETNPQLMEFAMDSRSTGMEKGFYREFRSDHIEDILKEAAELDFDGQDYFYTEKAPEDIQEIYTIMEYIRGEVAIFSRKIRNANGYTTARDNLDKLEKIKWHNVSNVDRPLEKWLIGLRLFAHTPVFKERRFLEMIVDDLLVHFEHLAGVNLNTLSDHEQEQLRHLVRYAAGLEFKVKE